MDHRRQLLPRELVGLIGVLGLHVLLGLVEYLVFGFTLNGCTTSTVDDLGHVSSWLDRRIPRHNHHSEGEATSAWRRFGLKFPAKSDDTDRDERLGMEVEMYEDIGPAGLGRGVAGGVAAGGAAAGGGLLPNTGVELLQIAAVVLLVVAVGVFFLRIASRRGTTGSE